MFRMLKIVAVLVPAILLLLPHPLFESNGAAAQQQPSPSDWWKNRVVVGFWNNTAANARFVSSKYNLPIVLEQNALRFAVFRPANVDVFLRAVKLETVVRYAGSDALACPMTDICGTGGGGGGGGGPVGPDFVIAADPTSLTITPGNSGTSTITVGVANNFKEDVTLTSSVSAVVVDGPSSSLNPTMIRLKHDPFGLSNLTVITQSSTPGISYTVTVTGTSGTLSHSVVITVNVPCTPSTVVCPNDPFYYGKQWGPSDLSLPQAWKKTVGTGNRIVAVVDSGIDYGHPDLQGNLWTAPDGSHGWNCVANNNNAADDRGHGTAVAGVIGATINNGIGIAGTAQVQIMSVKVLDDQGHGTASTFACGINWAVDHGANVINLSFRTDFNVTVVESVTHAWGRGALLVAAAGNDGTGGVVFPASLLEVIAVSALQQGDTRADFSNFGPKVELAAPGQNIYTTNWPGALPSSGCPSGAPYCFANGTSVAAPFVSGVAALIWDYNIQQGAGVLSNVQVRNALRYYADEMGDAGKDDLYGYGKPNALKLLNSIVSDQLYLLSARWEDPFGNRGSEDRARVWVFDVSASTWLLNGVEVGGGQVVSVRTGHVVRLSYDSCFFDGSRTVYVDHVQSSGFSTSYFEDVPSFTGPGPRDFVFPALFASHDAAYFVKVFGGC